MAINLAKYNRHWEKGFFYPYPVKRKAFDFLLSYLSKRQIIEITGLRRTGKSTLIFQLINHLIQKSAEPFSILYFTYDEEWPAVEILLQEYFIQTGIDYKKDKIYVFLDEIQKLPDFQNQIKIFYDLYPNIKFVISGSTSLFIKKKSRESLAGRIFSYILSPLSFNEYLIFKENTGLLDKPGLYSSELEKEFKIYLNSQFIESIFIPKLADKREYFSSIIKKIVFEDLPSVFRFDNPQVLWRICQFIAQKPGCIINNINLSSEFQINNKTVASYLSYLEEAFLVKKLYNFSKNLISSERRLKKYYLASPSFSSSLVDFSDYSSLFENYAVSLCPASYFFRDSYGHEVDFILSIEGKDIFPVEVKYKKEIKQNDLNNLLLFLDEFSITRGFLLYMGIKEKTIKIKGKAVTLIPYFELEKLIRMG